MIRLLIIVAFVGFSVGLCSADDVRFVDLTPEKYSGEEENLRGFGATNFRIVQQWLYNRKQHLRWTPSTVRYSKITKGRADLLTFTIHLEVKDRHGKVIHTEVGNYTERKSSAQPKIGLVTSASSPDDGSSNEFMLPLSKNIEVGYPTVNYWFSDITWKK